MAGASLRGLQLAISAVGCAGVSGLVISQRRRTSGGLVSGRFRVTDEVDYFLNGRRPGSMIDQGELWRRVGRISANDRMTSNCAEINDWFTYHSKVLT